MWNKKSDKNIILLQIVLYLNKCNIYCKMIPKLDTTKERHKVIFETYKQVIKNHGDMAKYIQKKILYEEVAAKCLLSTKYVQTVILMRTKIG